MHRPTRRRSALYAAAIVAWSAPCQSRRCTSDGQSRADVRQRHGAGRPRVPGLVDVDPPGAVGRDELRLRSRRQEGSRARRRHAPASDRHRRPQGLDPLRIESVLRRHGARTGQLEREAGAERHAAAARRAWRRPSIRRIVTDLERAHQRVGAARIRRRPLRGAGHGTVAGMPDGRRRSRTAADEVRRRLAQRPREGIHDADGQRRSARRRRGRRAKSA